MIAHIPDGGSRLARKHHHHIMMFFVSVLVFVLLLRAGVGSEGELNPIAIASSSESFSHRCRLFPCHIAISPVSLVPSQTLRNPFAIPSECFVGYYFRLKMKACRYFCPKYENNSGKDYHNRFFFAIFAVVNLLAIVEAMIGNHIKGINKNKTVTIMDKFTIQQLQQMRESEDRVEFKAGEGGNVSYDGRGKTNLDSVTLRNFCLKSF